MRKLVLLLVDVALILLATLFALFLRENFNVSSAKLIGFLPFLLATLVMALAVFPLTGLNRSVWRFSSLHDHLLVTAAVSATVAGAVGIDFAYDRLEGVARSLPFLQFLTGTAFLTGVRVLHRLAHDFSSASRAAPALLRPGAQASPAKTVLIVGISRLAEAYLRAAAELAPGQIKIAGVASRSERHAGRLVSTHPVLGKPEDLGNILDTLEVHGIAVDCVAVAVPFEVLSARSAGSSASGRARPRHRDSRFVRGLGPGLRTP